MMRMTHVLAKCSFVVVLLAARCFAANELASYKAVVSYADPYHATVIANLSLSEPGPFATPVRLAVYPGQMIVGLKLGDKESSIDPATEGGTTLRVPTNVDNSYSIRYSVVSRSRISHVPLPVPVLFPGRREHFIQVEVVLPAGNAVYDDAFPQRTWSDATHGLSRLPAVPAVVSLKFAPDSEITWLMQWSSAGRLSTLLMLSILVAGCGILYWFKRPRRRMERAV